jgi:hypothetical protein
MLFPNPESLNYIFLIKTDIKQRLTNLETGMIGPGIQEAISDTVDELQWTNIKDLEKKINTPKKQEFSDLIVEVATDFIIGHLIKFTVKAIPEGYKFISKYVKQKGIKKLAKDEVLLGSQLTLDFLDEKIKMNALNLSFKGTDYVGNANKLLNKLDAATDSEEATKGTHDFLQEFLGEALDASLKNLKTDFKEELKTSNYYSKAAITEVKLEELKVFIHSIDIRISTFLDLLRDMIDTTENELWLHLMYLAVPEFKKRPGRKNILKDNFIDILNEYKRSVLFVGMTIENADLILMPNPGYKKSFSGGRPMAISHSHRYINKHNVFSDVAVTQFKVISTDSHKKELFRQLKQIESDWAQTKINEISTVMEKVNNGYSLKLEAVKVKKFKSNKIEVAIVLLQSLSFKGQTQRNYIFLHMAHPFIEAASLSRTRDNDVYALSITGCSECLTYERMVKDFRPVF